MRERQGSRLRSSSTEVGQMKWMLFPWRQCSGRRNGAWCAPQARGGWDVGSGRMLGGMELSDMQLPPGGILSPSLGGGPKWGPQVRSWLSRTHLNITALPVEALPARNSDGAHSRVTLPSLSGWKPRTEHITPSSWNGGSTEAASLE